MESFLNAPARILMLLAMVMALACSMAGAAEFQREGSRLIAVGTLDIDGARQLAEHLVDKGVRTLVFENSFGGTPEGGEAWAEVVRGTAVHTEINGQCQGACAIAFLAGRDHRFARGVQVNGLLIPLGERPGAEALKVLVADFTTPAPRDGWQPAQGLLFTSTPTLFGRVYNTFWCNGNQGTDTSKCERVSDADPFRLGVLAP